MDVFCGSGEERRHEDLFGNGKGGLEEGDVEVSGGVGGEPWLSGRKRIREMGVREKVSGGLLCLEMKDLEDGGRSL